MNDKFISVLNESKKDYRNIASKKDLSKFISDCCFSGKVTNIFCGTSVTRYEIEVNPRTISYFLKLERNFNAFFNTNDVRIFQNGKFVCLEVPNKYRGTYGMRDCLRALQEKGKTENSLNIAIGESLNGKCITCDLTEMPHLLVAGQTGSGKSIFLHNIVLSLIMQYSEEELNLILIDPKKVEFEFYRPVSCVREVVTSTEKATERINLLCDEMDARYKLFSESSVRDINSFNRTQNVKLPRIVLIVEELADLAISSNDNIIKSIQRLLYKARACGIHVIVSTQRPDSDFMSGKIKANFQCRAIFSTASAIDSRIALGRYGAEKLKGNGDGILRMSNGQANIRFQSAFVTEKEIKDVVKLICRKEI